LIEVHDQQAIAMCGVEPAQKQCVLAQRRAVEALPARPAQHRIGATELEQLAMQGVDRAVCVPLAKIELRAAERRLVARIA